MSQTIYISHGQRRYVKTPCLCSLVQKQSLSSLLRVYVFLFFIISLIYSNCASVSPFHSMDLSLHISQSNGTFLSLYYTTTQELMTALSKSSLSLPSVMLYLPGFSPISLPAQSQPPLSVHIALITV